MKKLRVLAAAVVGVVAFGAAPAFASSTPIVITYEKDCNQLTGRCDGFTGTGDAFFMQVTSFQPHRQGRPADGVRGDRGRRGLVQS